MIYHYYIDPAILTGEPGNDASLLNVFNFVRGIGENVLISVFDDDHLREEFGSAISAITNPDLKLKIQKLFKRLEKQNRFTYSVETNYEGAKEDLQSVVEQCSDLLLDAIITEQSVDQYGVPVPDGRVFNFSEYLTSYVEEDRSRLAARGRMCAAGDQDIEAFLSENFRLLLKYATRIDICDKLLGEKYGTSNWKTSIQKLLAYVEEVNESASRCAVTFHTSCPGGKGKDELKRWICEGLAHLQPTLRVYGAQGDRVNFHHDRFIVTDQFAIMVTCGFDVLNMREDCNRDTNLDYKDPKDINDSIAKAEAEYPSSVV
jgi:hypothetical protein